MLLVDLGNRAYAYKKMEEGKKCMSLSDMNVAIGCFSEAMKYMPENGELQFYLGSIYLNTGQQINAIKYLRKSLNYRLDKNTYIMLGLAYQELKDYRNSEKVFKDLEEKFPNLLIPKLLLGQLYCEMSDKTKAKEKFTEVTAMVPKINNRYAQDIKTEAQKLLLKL
jgi:tetratricopeptide (TPR) repeat protein